MSFHRPCPACEGRRLEPIASVQPDHLLLCTGCGLVFESRTPSEQQLAEHYGQYSYGHLKPCPPSTQASYRHVLQTLLPWRGQGRLLDLGCGQGDFLVEAAAAHWQPTGMEFSQAAVSLCTQRGLEVVQGSLRRLCAGQSTVRCGYSVRGSGTPAHSGRPTP